MDPDSEQIFHDLEQRHVLLRKEHDVVCIEREASKGSRFFHNTLSTFTVSRLATIISLDRAPFYDSTDSRL